MNWPMEKAAARKKVAVRNKAMILRGNWLHCASVLFSHSNAPSEIEREKERGTIVNAK